MSGFSRVVDSFHTPYLVVTNPTTTASLLTLARSPIIMPSYILHCQLPEGMPLDLSSSSAKVVPAIETIKLSTGRHQN